MLILPAAVVAAAAAAVVLTAATAAVLVVQAANAAAEGAVRALGDYGELLERVADGQHRAEVQAQVWSAVAGDVVEINARIRLLAERASGAGVAVAVPKPLRLDGLRATEAVDWAKRAARELNSAQDTLYAALAARQGQRISALLPKSAGARPDTNAALARFHATLRERYASRPAPVVASTDWRAAVDEVLRTLDPDADEREYADILGAAALVDADDQRAAGAYLGTLRTKVHSANGLVARRRLAARWLSALEEPIVAQADLPQPFLDTAAKLRAVVTGESDLNPETRVEGKEAAAWAAEVTRQRFVRDTIHTCLAGQGYAVETDFDLQHSAELRLTRAAWQGEHSASIWVDRQGTVHGRLVRESTVAGDEATMRERARCVEFNGDLTALGSNLHAEVDTDDTYVPQNNGVNHVDSLRREEPIQRYH
jgi:hypothetical protein